MNSKKTRRLLAALFAAVLVPFIIYAGVVSRMTDNLVLSQIYYSSEQSFAQTHTFLSYKIDKLQRYIRSLAYNEQITTILSQNHDDYSLSLQLTDMDTLRTVLISYRDIDDVSGIRLYVHDSLIYSRDNRYMFKISSISETRWYQNLVDVKLGYFYITSEQSGDEGILSIAKCLRSADDYSKIAGVLRIDFKKSDITDILKKANVIDAGLTVLYNAGNEIVACSDPEWLDKYGLSINNFRFDADGDSFRTIFHNNKAFLVRDTAINGSHWRMATIIPEYELIKSTRRHYGIILAGFVMVALICILITYSGSVAATKLREAELKALQAQINPHFLYNTLDMISWMAKKHETDGVIKAVRSLSRLYRIGLSKGGDMITVRDELTHVSMYFDIQNMRFDGRLKLKIDTASALEELKIPKLILQPLVENSINHGILEKACREGLVSVKIHRDNDFLVLEVRDDGIGMDEQKLAKIMSEGKSYGLINIRERLKLMNIRNTIEIESVVGKYTLVCVRIFIKPKRSKLT